MLLQYSVIYLSIIYSCCSEFLKVMVAPIYLCQGSPSAQGTVAQTSDRAWDREAPQSFTPRTKLVRNSKITSPGQKTEEVGIYLDVPPKTSPAIAEPGKEAREGRPGISLLLHYPFPCPRLPKEPCAHLVRGRSPMTGRAQPRPFCGAALSSAPAKHAQNQGLSKLL